MKTSSCKAKGRRAAQYIRDKFLEWCPDLQADDIVVTPSGVTGPDLHLSPKAREVYNYAVESKCQEALNFWTAFEQAKSHVKGDEIPILVASRNRTKPVVVIDLEDFLKLTR